MLAARSEHTATLLSSGRLLVAGGHDPGGPPRPGAELYDPTARTWTSTAAMKNARKSHTATLLHAGNVLVAGGLGPSGPLAAAELYDPAAGQWTSTASLGLARAGHTATFQPSGRVMVAGGTVAGNAVTASVESYDPLTGRWTPAAPLSTARAHHTATLLPSGQTLVAGGLGAGCSAELYDPQTGNWTVTGSMSTCRSGHAAILLRSGKVLVAGGAAASAAAELYDPATGRWTPTMPMVDGRDFASASLLPGGQVIVTGGPGGRVELFEPELGGPPAWQPKSPSSRRCRSDSRSVSREASSSASPNPPEATAISSRRPTIPCCNCAASTAGTPRSCRPTRSRGGPIQPSPRSLSPASHRDRRCSRSSPTEFRAPRSRSRWPRRVWPARPPAATIGAPACAWARSTSRRGTSPLGSRSKPRRPSAPAVPRSST